MAAAKVTDHELKCLPVKLVSHLTIPILECKRFRLFLNALFSFLGPVEGASTPVVPPSLRACTFWNGVACSFNSVFGIQ